MGKEIQTVIPQKLRGRGVFVTNVRQQSACDSSVVDSLRGGYGKAQKVGCDQWKAAWTVSWGHGGWRLRPHRVVPRCPSGPWSLALGSLSSARPLSEPSDTRLLSFPQNQRSKHSEDSLTQKDRLLCSVTWKAE